MSLAEERALASAKLWRRGVVLLAAALVFVLLAATGTLPVAYALAGFAALAAIVAAVAVRETPAPKRVPEGVAAAAQ